LRGIPEKLEFIHQVKGKWGRLAERTAKGREPHQVSPGLFAGGPGQVLWPVPPQKKFWAENEKF